MTTTKLYFTQDTKIDGNHHAAGEVYQINTDEAEAQIAEGVAERVELGTLDEMERKGDTLADSYEAERRDLMQNDRYKDNEAERDYLLTKLEAETREAIEKLEFDYVAEMQALKVVAATEALKPVGTPEQVGQARAIADTVETQLMIATNPRDVIDMLRLSARTFDDVTKIELLRLLPSIKSSAGDSYLYDLRIIEKDLRTFESATDHHRTLRHIRGLEDHGAKPSTKYRTTQTIRGGKR